MAFVSEGFERPATTPALIVLVISAATLGTAYTSQYVGGLDPCQLCLYQRWPWWGALAIAALALVPALTGKAQRLLVLLAGIVLLGGAVLAFYHAGVEYKWWPGPSSCGAGTIPSSFAEMQKSMSKPIVPCDTPAWTLFGISMAGYNGLMSLAIGLFAVKAAGGRAVR